MHETDRYRFIQSDLFTFYVGEEKEKFVVHSRAISATSPYFDRLVNGSLSEAQSRSAELEDVDPDTFIRFLEYAYRRDYTTPSWSQDIKATNDNTPTRSSTSKSPSQVLVPLMSEEGHSSQQVAEPGIALPSFGNNWSSWGNSNAAPSAFGTIPSSKKTRKLNKTQMGSRTAFNQREYIHQTNNASSLLRLEFHPILNTSPTQNFAFVFLAHARVYTFAEMRMVHPLKELALHKLHKTLVGFKLYPERLVDVLELARYAYEHGEDRSEDGRIDALRDMMVNYIACEMKVLGKHAGFRNLMDGGGEFAGDFWDIASQELL